MMRGWLDYFIISTSKRLGKLRTIRKPELFDSLWYVVKTRFTFSDLTYILSIITYQLQFSTKKQKQIKALSAIYWTKKIQNTHITPKTTPGTKTMHLKSYSVLACETKNSFFFRRFLFIHLPWEPCREWGTGRQKINVYKHKSRDKPDMFWI